MEVRDAAGAPDVERAERAVHELLLALGVDEGEHTKNTPARVARSMIDQLWGYREVPEDHLDTDFPAPGDAGLIVMADIPVISMCAHHLLPFSGRATVAYRPSRDQRIVGLSKLVRLVNGYAARLQVQEQLGYQVVSGIMRKLKPSGATCIITATHDCLRLRGVKVAGVDTTTVASDGLLLPHEQEFIQKLHMESTH